MGGTINAGTDSNIKQSESKTGTVKAGTSGDRSTKTAGSGNGSGTVTAGSRTDAAGSRTDAAGSGTDAGTVKADKSVKTEKADKLSVLKDLPNVNIPEPQQPKQKRKYTKKVKEEKTQTINSEQVTTLIVAVSSMVASREGCAHWLISESEAKQIAEPLSNIIEKNESLKSLGEHADAIALVSACLMIFAPRLIISFQNSKVKKGVKKNGKYNDVQTTNSSKQVPRKDAVTPSVNGSSIFDAISAIQ